MVRRVVGVAPRDTVKGDVVLVVFKTAQRGFGLAQTRAVGRVARQAGRNVDDAAVLSRRGDLQLNVFAGDDRLRLCGIQAGLGRGNGRRGSFGCFFRAVRTGCRGGTNGA